MHPSSSPPAPPIAVYLKSIALIVYMAMVGCFVPAQSAVVGLVDKIFARIQSTESASAHASAFSLDLNQISLMLRHATPHSLLLLDEFGKGTACVDGVALLAATIRAILRPPGSTAPARAVLATHFREVFDLGLLGIPDTPCAGEGGEEGPAAAASAPPPMGLPMLPQSARDELSFYQMQVCAGKWAGRILGVSAHG